MDEKEIEFGFNDDTERLRFLMLLNNEQEHSGNL